jgi:chromosome partitioning protein
METIAIFNLKGGTAKSTSAVNLASAWAAEGLRVLVVDLDPQGNASVHLGQRDDGKQLRAVLADRKPLEHSVISTDYDRIDLAPGGEWLADVEPSTRSQALRELRLEKALRDVTDTYDLVLLDCPPSPGLLNISALLAADHVLIPVEAQGAAIDGLVSAMDRIDEVNAARDTALNILGVMVCKYDTRTSLSREVERAVRNNWPDLTLETFINRNTRVAEAYSRGRPVLDYAPDSRGSKDYIHAAQEISRRLS